MSKFYTYSSWEETFKPINNKFKNDLDFFAFETYGEEQEFIRNYDPKFIWTEVDGDSGTYIVAGYHYVNRIQYYITTNPWEDEYTEVPSWVYRQCDCVDEETDGVLTWDGDPNPDCTECDEGMIDIPIDTIEDLKAIYGEDAPIVS
jgi:hypothetical protein